MIEEIIVSALMAMVGIVIAIEIIRDGIRRKNGLDK